MLSSLRGGNLSILTMPWILRQYIIWLVTCHACRDACMVGPAVAVVPGQDHTGGTTTFAMEPGDDDAVPTSKLR